MSNWIFLSPHLDDAVYSCGGILYHLAREENNPVEVWTIFAGDPPEGEISPFAEEIHRRWHCGKDAPSIRRVEDIQASKEVGVSLRHFTFPDCIYRLSEETGAPLIQTNNDLFRLQENENSLLFRQIFAQIEKALPSDCTVVSPFGVGNHIDHQITRKVAEKLGVPLFYYADFPYASTHPEDVHQQKPVNAFRQSFDLTKKNLQAWKNGVAAYKTQLSSFWPSEKMMGVEVEKFARSNDGYILWKEPEIKRALS